MLGSMTSALEEAFRAHAWATRRLLEFCRELSSDQLVAGRNDATNWTILETFTHLVSADGYYVGTLQGTGRPVPRWNEDEPAWGLDVLLERAHMLAGLWEGYLGTDDDVERLVLLDEGTFECRAGVVITHALHHGDLHREQICSILRRLGVEPPDLQPWEYALEAGRARFVAAANNPG